MTNIRGCVCNVLVCVCVNTLLSFILAFLVGGAGGGEDKYIFGEEHFDDALLKSGEGCTIGVVNSKIQKKSPG